MYLQLRRTLQALVVTAIILAGAVTFGVVDWVTYSPKIYVDESTFPAGAVFKGQCSEGEIRERWLAKIDMYKDITERFGEGVCRVEGPFKPCYVMDYRNIKSAETLTAEEVTQVIQILRTHQAFQDPALSWKTAFREGCELRAAAAQKLFSEQALVGAPPRKINFSKIFVTGDLSYRPGNQRADYKFHAGLFVIVKDPATQSKTIQVIDPMMSDTSLPLDTWVSNVSKFTDPLPQVQMRDGCQLYPDSEGQLRKWGCSDLEGRLQNPKVWQMLRAPPKTSP